jgi:uncharacterized membrane protein
LGIGFIFGLMNLVLTPPFQVADEDRHFYRVYQVAEGGIIAAVHEDHAGGWLPESVFRCGSSTAYMRWRPDKTISRHDILKQFNEPLNPDQRIFRPFPSSIYSPAAYLPSAVIIRIGIWLEWPPVLLMYLGRLTNLVCWLLLIYAAIRFVPFYKWVFCVLALTPMSLYQGASLSADSMTNAVSFLTVAYFLYWKFASEKRIGRWGLLLIFSLTVLLSFSKIVFFLFCFLFLLIPRDKFSSHKRYYGTFILLVAANFLAFFIWYLAVKKMPITWKPDVFPDQQMLFILTRPLDYLQVFLVNLPAQMEHGARAFVGRFGWMDTPLPAWHFWTWAFVLLATILTDGRKDCPINGFDKTVCFVTFAMIYVLIITLLYIYWNPVAAEKMYVVQGRYFIPIAPLFFLCLYNKRLSFNFSARPVVLGGCTVLSLAHAMYVMYGRFYGC